MFLLARRTQSMRSAGTKITLPALSVCLCIRTARTQSYVTTLLRHLCYSHGRSGSYWTTRAVEATGCFAGSIVGFGLSGVSDGRKSVTGQGKALPLIVES